MQSAGSALNNGSRTKRWPTREHSAAQQNDIFFHSSTEMTHNCVRVKTFDFYHHKFLQGCFGSAARSDASWKCHLRLFPFLLFPMNLHKLAMMHKYAKARFPLLSSRNSSGTVSNGPERSEPARVRQSRTTGTKDELFAAGGTAQPPPPFPSTALMDCNKAFCFFEGDSRNEK